MTGRRRSAVAAEAEASSLPSPSVQVPPSTPSRSSQREVHVVKGSQSSSKKACHALVSLSAATSALLGWADLLECLLHEIIALFTSCHDLLAFIGTCRSWRAAFSSYPSNFTFAFPPLVLQPDVCSHHSYYPQNNFLSDTKWQLIDPTNATLSNYCPVPLLCETLDDMEFVGCSQGYLIFSSHEQCLLVDVSTGAQVRPPQLPHSHNCEVDYGILTAPLSLPNTYLLVCTKFLLFQWQVGSHTWSEWCLPNDHISQILVFQGQIFTVDAHRRLCSVHLEQQPSVEVVAYQCEFSKLMDVSYRPWLVVCGDVLLMVTLKIEYVVRLVRFEAFRLEFSAESPRWEKVDKLQNWAIFVGTDWRNPIFACKNPERWGGKSNHVYVASPYNDSTQPWFKVQLGQASQRMSTEIYSSGMWAGNYRRLEPLWVFPSMISRVDQSSLSMAKHGLWRLDQR